MPQGVLSWAQCSSAVWSHVTAEAAAEDAVVVALEHAGVDVVADYIQRIVAVASDLRRKTTQFNI